jgi:hypothetical protein
MKVFKQFNSDGPVCPICKTRKNGETVLVPIKGSEDGNNMQAEQVHLKCFNLINSIIDMGGVLV